MLTGFITATENPTKTDDLENLVVGNKRYTVRETAEMKQVKMERLGWGGRISVGAHGTQSPGVYAKQTGLRTVSIQWSAYRWLLMLGQVK